MGDTESTTDIHHCIDCSVKLRSTFPLFSPKHHVCANPTCNQPLCPNCSTMNPLITDSTTHKIQCYCQSCFRQLSTLDYSRTWDLLQGTSNLVFVFVHGGGGSRAMFRKHAEILVEKYHHSCILIDLPGHGSLVHVPLTLDSCVDTVANIMGVVDPDKARIAELEEFWMQAGTKTVVYVGGSLGAYTGFHILSKLKHRFHGAILLDCGQNVGPDASLKARLGLMLLSFIGTHTSNARMMSMMQSVVAKSKADFFIHETSFSSGMFFQQAAAQVECLKRVAPAELIPTLDIPILFMNGTEDYRDSEDQWLSLCKHVPGSNLIDYTGGDHFFTHDSRFVDDILEKWNEFAIQVDGKRAHP